MAMSLAGTLLWVAPARADSDDAPSRTQKPQSRAPSVNAAEATGADEVDGPTIFEGVPGLGPLDHARDVLRDTYGVYLHGNYFGDPYADLGGGMRRGTAYAGRLDLQMDIDAEKIVGAKDLTLHANMYAIQGRDLSKTFIGNVLSTNDIAALPTTRLYELWAEQKFGDQLSVRAGQLGIDVEFLTSNYGANFIDATFGWPGLPSLDLPQGGPAYPLAAPAVRIKYDPTGSISILAAVFDGQPAGPGVGDPQTRDRYGLNFRLSDPPLALVESQVRYNQGEGAKDLPGTVKIGAFAQFGGLAGQTLNTGGVFMPNSHAPNAGVYGIIDQQVYRMPGDEPQNGVGVFARVIAAPDARNPVDFYADAGVSAAGLIPGRPHDVFGIAGAIMTYSPTARALDAADDAATGIAAPIRTFEAVIELTYSAQIIPGLAAAADVSVHRPSRRRGGRPLWATARHASATQRVFGVTTVVRF